MNSLCTRLRYIFFNLFIPQSCCVFASGCCHILVISFYCLCVQYCRTPTRKSARQCCVPPQCNCCQCLKENNIYFSLLLLLCQNRAVTQCQDPACLIAPTHGTEEVGFIVWVQVKERTMAFNCNILLQSHLILRTNDSFTVAYSAARIPSNSAGSLGGKHYARLILHHIRCV